jgi:hypothetical protein
VHGRTLGPNVVPDRSGDISIPVTAAGPPRAGLLVRATGEGNRNAKILPRYVRKPKAAVHGGQQRVKSRPKAWRRRILTARFSAISEA